MLFPAMLLLIFGCIQGALHYHARDLANAAASEAVTAASVTGGTAAGGRTAAQRFIDTAGRGTLIDTTVTVRRGARSVTATVTGRSINILPGVPTPAIQQTVSGPVERTN